MPTPVIILIASVLIAGTLRWILRTLNEFLVYYVLERTLRP